MAQSAAPTAGFEVAGMDGKTLDCAGLNGIGSPGAGTGGTGPVEPGKVPATGSGTGVVGGSAGMKPAPATGAKAAP